MYRSKVEGANRAGFHWKNDCYAVTNGHSDLQGAASIATSCAHTRSMQRRAESPPGRSTCSTQGCRPYRSPVPPACRKACGQVAERCRSAGRQRRRQPDVLLRHPVEVIDGPRHAPAEDQRVVAHRIGRQRSSTVAPARPVAADVAAVDRRFTYVMRDAGTTSLLVLRWSMTNLRNAYEAASCHFRAVTYPPSKPMVAGSSPAGRANRGSHLGAVLNLHVNRRSPGNCSG
jgi:hypothetical protein